MAKRDAHSPALLVAVRVAEQYALAAAVSLEMPAVDRLGEELAQRFAAPLERLERLELRGDVERNLTGALVVDGRPASESQRREYIVGAASRRSR